MTIWYIGARSAWDTVQIGPFKTKGEAVSYVKQHALWSHINPELIVGSKEICSDKKQSNNDIRNSEENL
jgi:hypothetical protein